MIDNSTSFLGTGWSFPPAFSKDTGGVNMVSGDTDIKQSLHILFTTLRGERIMLPEYGCDLNEFLFGLADNSAITFMKDLINNAILHYEPRITVNDIGIDPANIMDGLLLISLDYTIRTTNSRNNIVYPYYITEGNLVDSDNI